MGPSPTAPTISIATRISGTPRIAARSAFTGVCGQDGVIEAAARIPRTIESRMLPSVPRTAMCRVSTLACTTTGKTVASGGHIRDRNSATRGPLWASLPRSGTDDCHAQSTTRATAPVVSGPRQLGRGRKPCVDAGNRSAGLRGRDSIVGHAGTFRGVGTS